MRDNLIQRLLIPYRRYIDFKGRSSRREYWLFVLLFVTVLILTMTLQELLPHNSMAYEAILFIWGLFFIGSIIPGLAAAARRLHDGGHSAWWLLIYFVPIIGAIWLLILLLAPSQPRKNRWGPNPKSEQERTGLDTLDSGFVAHLDEDELL